MRQGRGRYFNPSRGAATNGILCKVRGMTGRFVGFMQGNSLEVTVRTSSLASQLPQILAVCMQSVQHIGHCGSWLASDRAGSDTLKSG